MVLGESSAPRWPRQAVVVPAESGTPAGPVKGRWSWASLAPPAGPIRGGGPAASGAPCWPSPLRAGAEAGLCISGSRFIGRSGSAGPRGSVHSPPTPCLACSTEDISPGAEGPRAPQRLRGRGPGMSPEAGLGSLS